MFRWKTTVESVWIVRVKLVWRPVSVTASIFYVPYKLKSRKPLFSEFFNNSSSSVILHLHDPDLILPQTSKHTRWIAKLL